ncbi:MAG: 30S ribosomal protein S3 [Oscillospiraceae bacterium]|nr:30S ribosomal protein S3 [Oscillospiraceae bacterium]
MGQKVNPHGFRVGVIKDWDSHWYAKKSEMGDLIVEDYNRRKFIKKKLYDSGISRVGIDRTANAVKVNIYCAKPGMVIGNKGADVEILRKELEKMTGKTVSINIVSIKSPDLDAQLVAENIASQLERRVSYRRAMKQSIQRSMRSGAKGIKTAVSGRLGGADIARSESYHEGTIPLQTLRADIDYGFAEANTTYGIIGCKVWIYHGEILSGVARQQEEQPRNARPARRRDGREGRDGRDGRNNRGFDRRRQNNNNNNQRQGGSR